jgi:hypothetical protein
MRAFALVMLIDAALMIGLHNLNECVRVHGVLYCLTKE